MNIIIVGGGKVGSYLATLLGNRGYNVHIVESRKAVAQRLEEKAARGFRCEGHGFEPGCPRRGRRAPGRRHYCRNGR